jgi:hypothetical protein
MEKYLYLPASCLSVVAIVISLAIAQAPPPAQTRMGSESGYASIQQQCMSCHGRKNVPGAPHCRAEGSLSGAGSGGCGAWRDHRIRRSHGCRRNVVCRLRLQSQPALPSLGSAKASSARREGCG